MPMSSFYLAKKKNAWAATPPATPLWNLSKRELVEIALHLAAASTESYDDALENGEAARRVLAERDNLKAQGIV